MAWLFVAGAGFLAVLPHGVRVLAQPVGIVGLVFPAVRRAPAVSGFVRGLQLCRLCPVLAETSLSFAGSPNQDKEKTIDSVRCVRLRFCSASPRWVGVSLGVRLGLLCTRWRCPGVSFYVNKKGESTSKKQCWLSPGGLEFG